MNTPVRIVLFALEYGAAREIGDLLSAPGHDVLVVRSVDEAAGLWLGMRPELLVLDAPAPALCLQRLEHRLGVEAIGLNQPALVILPEGPGAAAMQGDRLLASCIARPLSPAAFQERVRTLLRLSRALRRLRGDEDQASAPAPAPSPSPGGSPASATADCLLALLGLRDSVDEGHSRRVARLSGALADRLNLGSEPRGALERASLWHDLGKLAVHHQLLRKPSRLTAVERSAVQTHPGRGMGLVRELFADDAAALIVLHHHERADGTGYFGLSRDQASLAARILAFAEAWDSLTSEQVFRRANRPEDAWARIKAEGSRWDPLVLAAFEDLCADDGPLAASGPFN